METVRLLKWEFAEEVFWNYILPESAGSDIGAAVDRGELQRHSVHRHVLLDECQSGVKLFQTGIHSPIMTVILAN